MKLKFATVAAGIAMAALGVSPASAADFLANIFDSGAVWNSSGTAGSNHYFFFNGSHVSETYSGTGLGAVDSLALAVPFAQSNTQDLGFTVSLNGTDIGAWLVSAGTNSNAFANLAYSFAPISAFGGNSYTVALRVTQGLCLGCGNVDLNQVGRVDLSGASGGGVPEPASWALMILGFGATGAALRRRRLVAA